MRLLIVAVLLFASCSGHDKSQKLNEEPNLIVINSESYTENNIDSFLAAFGDDDITSLSQGMEFPFSVSSGADSSRLISRQEFLGAPYSYIPKEDFDRISRRKFCHVRVAGWRGAYLDGGKVWLDVSPEDGELRIRSFNSNLPWQGDSAEDSCP